MITESLQRNQLILVSELLQESKALLHVSTEMREKVVLFHWENFKSSYRTVKSKKDCEIIEGFPPVSNIRFPFGILRQVASLKSENSVTLMYSNE